MVQPGFIFINKPPGITSYDVIRRLKREIPARMGHTGTLDPIATGLLIIAVGRATKFIEFFHHLPKEYIATVKLGVETDTLDIEGRETARDPDFRLRREELERALEKFRGKIQQVPPRFSAKRIKGQRAYELARKGEEFELKPKEVELYEYQLLNVNEEENEFSILLRVSTGFFVRSFARDVARELGTHGIIRILVRTAIGPFTVDEARSLEEEPEIVPIEDVLSRFMPRITIEKRFVKLYINGGEVYPEEAEATVELEGKHVMVYSDGKFLGVGKVREGRVKSEKLVFVR